MKQKIKIMICAAFMLPMGVAAQRVQPLPENISEVHVDGKQKLLVVGGDETRIETTSDRTNIATVRGNRLKVSVGDGEQLTLRLAPERCIVIRAEDYATVNIDGSLPLRDLLAVHVEDYAVANFTGTDSDTVRCLMLRLQSEDFARINASSILQHFEYDLSASDYSRIELSGLDQMPNPTDSGFSTSTTLQDFGKVYKGRITDNGELVRTDYPSYDRDYTTVVNGMTDRLADAVRKDKGGDTERKHTATWEFGGGELVFAWGWHNWGNEMFTGFGGVDGAAGVGTTFNNIQLAGDWVIARSRWIGFYAGLGLEWDKWKFTAPSVQLNTAAEPYAFAASGATTGNMLLTTRYVIVPLTIRVGDRDGVHLELSAIPGIHWNASGLRTKQVVGNSTETTKDRSINKYLNPYKLDLRAALYYNHFGIYAQFSTQSVFKGNCEELFPVKFGFII